MTVIAEISGLLLSAATFAQANSANSYDGPQPAPVVAPILAPRDTPYVGPLSLAVDATDITRHIFHVHEVVPVVGPGPLTLLYPEWIPGAHAAIGPIDKFADLVIRAGGQRVPWKRDPVHVYAFHLNVPAGVRALDVDFEYLSPVHQDEGRVVMTPAMLDLEWNAVSLYPAGFFARDIEIDPRVKLPAGWKCASALEVKDEHGGTIEFERTTYNTLVDSPVLAGRYFERLDLNPGAKRPVHLDVVADRPDLLAITPSELAKHRALVQQADRLFQSHHYDHYDFLLSLRVRTHKKCFCNSDFVIHGLRRETKDDSRPLLADRRPVRKAPTASADEYARQAPG